MIMKRGKTKTSRVSATRIIHNQSCSVQYRFPRFLNFCTAWAAVPASLGPRVLYTTQIELLLPEQAMLASEYGDVTSYRAFWRWQIVERMIAARPLERAQSTDQTRKRHRRCQPPAHRLSYSKILWNPSSSLWRSRSPQMHPARVCTTDDRDRQSCCSGAGSCGCSADAARKHAWLCNALAFCCVCAREAPFEPYESSM